jgi:hypothetical protein
MSEHDSVNHEELQLSVILNSKVGITHDSLENEISALGVWLNSLVSQSHSDAIRKKARCEICDSKDEHDAMELHHIAGRKHDFRTVTTCLKCHRILSDSQKLWDRQWLVANQVSKRRRAFFLQGIHDILVLRAEKTSNSILRNLAQNLIENISILLR